MSPEFRKAIESLHTKFECLIRAAPYAEGACLPKEGVYLFSKNGAHFYVGRSNNIPQRRRQHTQRGAQPSQAALARLIACEELNLPPSNYRKGAGARFSTHEFKLKFEKAKDRIQKMEFRAVDECDPTKQALLEIYCAITLKTHYNDFDVH